MWFDMLAFVIIMVIMFVGFIFFRTIYDYWREGSGNIFTAFPKWMVKIILMFPYKDGPRVSVYLSKENQDSFIKLHVRLKVSHSMFCAVKDVWSILIIETYGRKEIEAKTMDIAKRALDEYYCHINKKDDKPELLAVLTEDQINFTGD